MNRISLKILGDPHAGIDGKQTCFPYILHVFYFVRENRYLLFFYFQITE